MVRPDNFNNYNVVISVDDDDTHEIKTKLVSFSEEYMIIEVKGNLSQYKDDTINVIILHTSGVHEFCGNIKRVKDTPAITEIALFKGKAKESRGAKRYRVDVDATVDNLIVNGSLYPLLKPLRVSIVDLSRTGLRLKTRQRAFNVEAKFQVRFVIDSNESILQGRVVWVKAFGSDTAEYGCELVRLE